MMQKPTFSRIVYDSILIRRYKETLTELTVHDKGPDHEAVLVYKLNDLYEEISFTNRRVVH